MASRQARKSESAAQASGSDEENSQQSTQDADMHVLNAARDMVSTVKITVLHFWVVFTDFNIVQDSSRVKAESHRRRVEETRCRHQCQTLRSFRVQKGQSVSYDSLFPPLISKQIGFAFQLPAFPFHILQKSNGALQSFSLGHLPKSHS